MNDNNKSKKPKLSKSIFINMLLATLLSTGILGGMWISSEYSTFQIESKSIRDHLLTTYKELLKSEVSKASSYIEYEKMRVKPLLKETIKSRVNEAHSVAMKIFNQNKGKKTLPEIQEMIKEALRPLRFNEGRGYYFAFNLQGVEELFVDKPEMEGKNMLLVRGAKGEYVVRDMLRLVKTGGEGFYEYTWTKPNMEGHYSKIAYVKLFEPLGWVIGTGEYLDNVENDLKKEAIRYIEQIKYGKDGYIFVGQWDGVALSGPAIGRNMWDVADSNGKKIVQELIRQAKKGSGYFEYVMPKLEDKKTAPKLSYVVGVPEWQWYVGTGIYIDEIETAIENKKNEFEKKIIGHLVKIALALMGLVAMVFYIALVVSRKTRNNFDSFVTFFKKSTVGLDVINPDGMDFVELHDLAISANAMVTALKQAEVELVKHREHLEVLVEERTSELLLARNAADAASRAKSIFLANMSHEIRTPMNAVLGFAQLLERDLSLSSVVRNRVSAIIKSGDHLLEIINDILEMSRIEAGRVEMRVESVDMHALLDDLAVMFRLRAEQKGLSFVLESADDLSRYILTDLGKLRQILINLLDNAVKFTKTGFIVLRAFQEGTDRIAIEVQDSGIGITAEEQGKLFHPFERTRSGEQVAGGTGLGLAISREYANLMKGDITLSSRAGEGSCFRFVFHAPTPMSPIPPAVVSLSHVTALASGQGDIHVLIVDDQSSNRELLRDMLEPLGFIVSEASDGGEAIEKTNALNPRIILMDLVMPNMDGVEATRTLRNTYTKESLVIIGITASIFGENKKQFIDSGINAFIAKPFRIQELLDVLARHAGVLFEAGESEEVSAMQQKMEIPTIDKMSPEWREEFWSALDRNNVTRLRKLGTEAKEIDPLLSAWILERIAIYEIDDLKKMSRGHDLGVDNG
ncbi:MAG: cache domain-containing protein [Chlorobium sp.]|nr:cache domain-containing protein [Chlorobium sp.]